VGEGKKERPTGYKKERAGQREAVKIVRGKGKEPYLAKQRKGMTPTNRKFRDPKS